MFQIERQIEVAIEWLDKMAEKIPSMENEASEKLLHKLSVEE